MRRILLLPLLVWLLPALSAYAQSPPYPRVVQVDTSNYPNITLYVQVTDAQGDPITGLAINDFVVNEDGRVVTIDDFAGGGASPIKTVLVIDRSASMGEARKIQGAREAARAFVAQMRPGDQTAVIAFDARPQLVQPFTSDTARLDRAIRAIDTGSSTALYDSLITAVDQFKDVKGRKALLLLTDGRDCYQKPCEGNPASSATLDESIAYANSSSLPVQVIGLGERDSSDDSTGIDEHVLQQIAEQTHGSYFYAPSPGDLERLYRQLSAGMQQEYRLTYRSPRPYYDGTHRDILVQVGKTTVGSSYVERHLINVHSDPLVGVLLLLPILIALVLPILLRAGRRHPAPILAPAEISVTTPGVVDGPTIVQSAAVDILSNDPARCLSCDAPLLRAGARFCSECGSAQPVTRRLTEQRIFCDQCGRPIRPGGRFCSACGATAVLSAWEDGR